MNELQERFFTDFVFIWRFYIGDPLTWRYDSPVFRVLCIAFLRLAAWDFEVSFDTNVELPISFSSIPRWGFPKSNIYWFHGYLVVLQDDINSRALINHGISKAESHLYGTQFPPRDACLLLISPHHIAFGKLCNDTAMASNSLPLLTNDSGTQCSPGFRALSRVLTSNRWKPKGSKETWNLNVPPEIVYMIFQEMDPRDTIAFARVSRTSFTTLRYLSSGMSMYKAFSLSYPAAASDTIVGDTVFVASVVIRGNTPSASVWKIRLPTGMFVGAAGTTRSVSDWILAG